MGDRREARALVVVGVDARPVREARHDQLRGQGHDERNVQRGGEQLAGLGEQRQRLAVAQLRGMRALIAQDHPHPIPHQACQGHSSLVEVIRLADNESAEHAGPMAQRQHQQTAPDGKRMVRSLTGTSTDFVDLWGQVGGVVPRDHRPLLAVLVGLGEQPALVQVHRVAQPVQQFAEKLRRAEPLFKVGWQAEEP